jgi:trehalose utilization protein
MIRVTIWNEYEHEKVDEHVAAIYPKGIHGAIADGIAGEGVQTRTATLDEPEHGLTEDVLNETDVLIWWGHRAHGKVSDEIVNRVHDRVLKGMGLIVLHSGHFSKIFKKLMGTSCDLKWREAGDKERIWVVDPAHPIAEGLGQYFEIEHEEMYGEHFGCTYHRGNGKIFYFRPGHETYPTYHNKDVLKVISNAVRWAAPRHGARHVYGKAAPLEPIKGHV